MSSDDLQRTLAVYLEHDPLARSPMMRRVLGYLVRHATAGNEDALTPYRVAVDAFGKPADFDASSTASVRVEMARLRRILAELRARFPVLPGIDIPPGSYRPQPAAPLRPDASDQSALTAPATGPGIVVFRPRGELDAARAHLAGGIAQLVCAELVRQRWLHVVSAVDLDPAMPGLAEYCVDRCECQFALRGEIIALADDAVHIDIEVFDATLRRRVWFAPFEFRVGAAEQDGAALTAAIARYVGAPSGVITHAGLARAGLAELGGKWATADLVLRYHHFFVGDRGPELHAELSTQTQALLETSPDFAMGWTIMGGLERERAVSRLAPPEEYDSSLARAIGHFERALMLDPLLPRAALALASTRFFQADRDAFLTAIERALALSPNNPDHLHWAGALLCQAGERTRGLEVLRSADLMRHHALYYRGSSIHAALAAELYDLADELVASLPNNLPQYIFHYVASLVYARRGDRAAADAALQRAYQRCPELRTELQREVRKWFLDPTIAERIWQWIAPIAATDDPQLGR